MKGDPSMSMNASEKAALRVRPYQPGDEDFVLSLAPRLLIGIPAWRSAEKWLASAQQWLTADFENHGKQSMLFIAENEQGKRLGFAGVAHNHHFTGEGQAYLGELVVSEEAEGQGAGQALVHACEQGYHSLVLDTGAINNERARRFYQRLGFLEESVKLAKLL
jgi:ribosomal protein S18 acetylase RimI-like enzyme